MAERKIERMTVEAFLEWQMTQDRKYELVDGVPVLPLKAMTGATHKHDRVVVNILASLHGQLKGSRCKPTTDAIALKIPAGNIRRPDVTVECGKFDMKGTTSVEPRLVVEVLSPSTMNLDRVRKLDEYKSVPGLHYILLVDTEKPQLTLYQREAGEWTPEHFETLDAILDLPAIEARLAARDIFEGLPFAE